MPKQKPPTNPPAAETHKSKWLTRGVPAAALVSALVITGVLNKNQPTAPTTAPEEQTTTQPSAASNEATTPAPTTTTTTNGNGRRNSPPVSTPEVAPSTPTTPAVPAFTQELRNGQPLEEFPFPIMTDPPHSFHEPVTDFASVSNTNGSYIFTLPDTTNDLGLYGRFWLSPAAPAPNARLAGVRLTNASWSGTLDNSIVVFSLLDRQTENNARGTVTGAVQGLPDELVAVLFDQTSEQIELLLTTPVAESERLVFAVDSENLPTGNPTIYPDTIALGSIQWLWTTAQ